jgi:hypothetical protein
MKKPPVKSGMRTSHLGPQGITRRSGTCGRHKHKAYRLRSISPAIGRKRTSSRSILRAYTHLGNFDGRSGFYLVLQNPSERLSGLQTAKTAHVGRGI